MHTLVIVTVMARVTITRTFIVVFHDGGHKHIHHDTWSQLKNQKNRSKEVALDFLCLIVIGKK